MLDPAKFRDLDPGPRVLMGPGPSGVSDRVLRAMSTPCIGYLDPYLFKIMDETQELLRYVYGTANPQTLPVSGTGMAGMEAVLVNLIEPGDKVLVCVNGFFGIRLCEIAQRLGADLVRLDFPWGRAIDPEVVRGKVKEVGPGIVAGVHAETSTGACSDLAGLSQAAKEAGALVLADCVTSLGGIKVGIDENGIDAAYSGSQKCISAPPGLSPVTFGKRALEKMEARKTKIPSFYLDMTILGNYWGAKRMYHHTLPVNLVFAFREALRMVAEEGLEARFARHKLTHRALVAGVEEMGLSMLVPKAERLPMLNAIKIPEGAEDAKVRTALLKGFGLEIGGGLGDLAGKVWRVGIMGEVCNRRNVTLFLAALQSVLTAQGVKVGSGVEAATAVFEGA